MYERKRGSFTPEAANYSIGSKMGSENGLTPDKPSVIEEQRDREHNSRQIIGNNGEVIRFLERETEALGHTKSMIIGELTTPGELRNKYLAELEPLTNERCEIKEQIKSIEVDYIREHDPEYLWYYGQGAAPKKGDYDYADVKRVQRKAQDHVSKHHPELYDRLTEIKEEEGRLEGKYIYKFSRPGSDPDSIPVGEKGVLIQKQSSGQALRRRIQGIIDTLKEYKIYQDQDERHFYGGRNFNYSDMDTMVDLLPILERFVEDVGDADVKNIMQIEVLPEYRGQGHAKALLDAAEWDGVSTHERNEPYYLFGVVLDSNDDQWTMNYLFQNAGFQRLYIPESSVSGMVETPEHSLWIKANNTATPLGSEVALDERYWEIGNAVRMENADAS